MDSFRSQISEKRVKPNTDSFKIYSDHFFCRNPHSSISIKNRIYCKHFCSCYELLAREICRLVFVVMDVDGTCTQKACSTWRSITKARAAYNLSFRCAYDATRFQEADSDVVQRGALNLGVDKHVAISLTRGFVFHLHVKQEVQLLICGNPF